MQLKCNKYHFIEEPAFQFYAWNSIDPKVSANKVLTFEEHNCSKDRVSTVKFDLTLLVVKNQLVKL